MFSRFMPLPALLTLLLGLPPLAGLPLLMPPPAGAVELRGSTYFLRPPWSLAMLTYYSTVWDRQAEYYLTIELPEGAGAPLGRLTVQQTRGADWQFPFDVSRSRAFLGRPRHEGSRVPVQVSFNADQRVFDFRFPEPVPPGSTITVTMRPWANPSQSDTYLFQVVAFPAGPDPVASPVGVATLRIYDPSGF